MDVNISLNRATGATFFLALLVYAALSFPVLHALPAWVPAGAGGLLALYLAVGVYGAHGGTPDFMMKFWPACFAVVFGGALLRHVYLSSEWGWPAQLANSALQAFYAASAAASVVRFVLVMRPMPGNELPDPATVAGTPMAGPASVQAAHARLRRGGGPQRAKFRT